MVLQFKIIHSGYVLGKSRLYTYPQTLLLHLSFLFKIMILLMSEEFPKLVATKFCKLCKSKIPCFIGIFCSQLTLIL